MYPGQHLNSADFEPWQDSYKSHMAYLAKATPGLGQAWRGVLSCQLELWGLASGRARAMLDYPARLSRCETPADMVAENFRLANETVRAYSESSQRILCALAQTNVGPLPAPPQAAWLDVWTDTDRPAVLDEETRERPRTKRSGQYSNGAARHETGEQAAA